MQPGQSIITAVDKEKKIMKKVNSFVSTCKNDGTWDRIPQAQIGGCVCKYLKFTLSQSGLKLNHDFIFQPSLFVSHVFLAQGHIALIHQNLH